MLKYLQKNKTGQAISAEYVLIFFVVMGVMSAMFIYFQRALQARIYDARNAMVRSVADETYGGDYGPGAYGRDFVEYEPYYGNTESIISQKRNEETRMYPVTWGEHYKKEYEETTDIKSESHTAPPGEDR